MRPSGNCPGPNASGLRLGFAYRLFGGISAMQPELHRIAANTWRRRSIPTPRSGDCIASVVHQIARDRGYTCSQTKELKNLASEDARVRAISPSSEKLKCCGKYHRDGYRRIPLAKKSRQETQRFSQGLEQGNVKHRRSIKPWRLSDSPNISPTMTNKPPGPSLDASLSNGQMAGPRRY